MNISCEIIRDLLPLYMDDVCSDDSRNLVEGHLADCEECSRELNLMQGYLPEMKVSLDEIHVAEAAHKAWKTNKLWSLLKGIVITAILGVVLWIIGVLVFHPDVAHPVNESRMQVDAVYQLEDGKIMLQWSMNDNTLAMRSRAYREKDGALYFVPLGPLIEAHYSYWYYVTEAEEHDVKIFDPTCEWGDQYGGSHEGMNAIYLGWGDDAILVWEEGMELPEMTEEARAEYEAWYAEVYRGINQYLYEPVW